jgi:hypothetical protein
MGIRAKLMAALGASGLAGIFLFGALCQYGAAGLDRPVSDPLCGAGADVSRASFYTEIQRVNGRMHAGMEIEASGNIDRDFARMMISHHQGAIDMALLHLKYGRNEPLKRLAQSIIVEQGQEIAYMHMLIDGQAGPASGTSGITGR